MCCKSAMPCNCCLYSPTEEVLKVICHILRPMPGEDSAMLITENLGSIVLVLYNFLIRNGSCFSLCYQPSNLSGSLISLLCLLEILLRNKERFIFTFSTWTISLLFGSGLKTISNNLFLIWWRKICKIMFTNSSANLLAVYTQTKQKLISNSKVIQMNIWKHILAYFCVLKNFVVKI